jgi:sialate O-acetylesterase
MWEAGIRPLIPCAIRGVIWYQGESNAETPERVAEHNLLFPLLVNDWRQKWKQGDFPFLFVQLPAMGREHWPAFRDGQRRFLNELDNVGMAITIDTGHPTNVHPVDKRPVGERLAEWALGTTYAKQRFSVVSGPLFRKAEQHGTSLIIHFDHVGSALQTSDGQPPRHFELAGMDGVFHPATARLEGQTIVLSSSKVSEPRHARYGWMPYPKPPVNLLNSAKLPASPFTTLHGVLDKQ